MNTRNKFAFLTGTAMHFAPMSVCSIEGEGNDNAGGGGSSGGDGSGTDGNADGGSALTAEQQMEKEFSDPNDVEEDDGESSDGQQSGEDPGTSGEDEDGDEGGDADGDGDESGEKGEGEDQQPPKKTGRMQERFDELTATSRNHEREAEKWKAEAIKLGYVENGDQPSMPEEPDPEKYPYGEYDPEYLKDKGKFDAKVEMITEQATARFKAEASALDAKWTKNLAEKVEAYPDFDEVVVKGAQNWACPPVIAIAIKDSDVGPDIAYQLAKDPAEALRVSKLSPLEQAREFGRKESAFIQSKEIEALKAKVAEIEGKNKGEAEGTPNKTPRIVSKAPEPPRRRVSGGGARSETPADTDDFAAFERMADKKIEDRSKRT